jgi:Uma2 family endonuclease
MIVMPTVLAEADQITVEEFLAFYDARPKGEKWELVEGIARMAASPINWHQRIVANLVLALDDIKIAQNAPWTAIPGIGMRVPISPNSLPEPDAYVQEAPLEGVSVTSDALLIFEVLSRTNTKADRAWRKRIYASGRTVNTM